MKSAAPALSVPLWGDFDFSALTGLTVGANVASLTDRSGQQAPLTQSTASKQPTWQGDYAAFDGVDDLLASVSALPQPLTFVFIANPSATYNITIADFGYATTGLLLNITTRTGWSMATDADGLNGFDGPKAVANQVQAVVAVAGGASSSIRLAGGSAFTGTTTRDIESLKIAPNGTACGVYRLLIWSGAFTAGDQTALASWFVSNYQSSGPNPVNATIALQPAAATSQARPLGLTARWNVTIVLNPATAMSASRGLGVTAQRNVTVALNPATATSASQAFAVRAQSNVTIPLTPTHAMSTAQSFLVSTGHSVVIALQPATATSTAGQFGLTAQRNTVILLSPAQAVSRTETWGITARRNVTLALSPATAVSVAQPFGVSLAAANVPGNVTISITRTGNAAMSVTPTGSADIGIARTGSVQITIG